MHEIGRLQSSLVVSGVLERQTKAVKILARSTLMSEIKSFVAKFFFCIFTSKNLK